MLSVLEDPPMSLPPFACPQQGDPVKCSNSEYHCYHISQDPPAMGMPKEAGGVLSQQKGGDDMAPKMAAYPQNVHNMVMVDNAVNSI